MRTIFYSMVFGMLIVCLFSPQVKAHNRNINSKVVDKTDSPLLGALAKAKGSNMATIINSDVFLTDYGKCEKQGYRTINNGEEKGIVNVKVTDDASSSISLDQTQTLNENNFKKFSGNVARAIYINEISFI